MESQKSIFECNVRGRLEAILSEQISRLLSSGSIGCDDTRGIMETLKMQRLLPDQLEQDLCTEIQSICAQKFDEAIPTSSRLNGFGWSEGHLKKHMRRLLESKLSETATVLRTFVNN